MIESDAELLEAWGSGDAQAGSRLLTRYLRPVSRFFDRKAREDHDDLVQDTFVACLHNHTHLRDKGRFRAFLFGVASNVLRMHHRRRRLRQPLEGLAHDHGGSHPAHDDELTLLGALRQLPPVLQTVMALYYWEGLRTHEIAHAVALPIGTVRSHLRRGRQRIAQSIDDERLARAR